MHRLFFINVYKEIMKIYILKKWKCYLTSSKKINLHKPFAQVRVKVSNNQNPIMTYLIRTKNRMCCWSLNHCKDCAFSLQFYLINLRTFFFIDGCCIKSLVICSNFTLYCHYQIFKLNKIREDEILA